MALFGLVPEDPEQNSRSTRQFFKGKTFREMAGKEDSLFSFDQLEQKGFRQIYSDILDKLDVLTDCKYTLNFFQTLKSSDFNWIYQSVLFIGSILIENIIGK